jgi:hypothetical protein
MNAMFLNEFLRDREVQEQKATIAQLKRDQAARIFRK